jgi:hypothetical protein
MATKKSRKKRAKLKKSSAKRTPLKKTSKKKLVSSKKAAPKKRLAKKPAAKKAAVKTSRIAQKTTGAKTKGASKRRVPSRNQSTSIESFTDQEARTESAGQSGSLQGLSRSAGADSESVDELIEEGNAFEAGVVSGVEAADRADGQEVRTHEVPEDDVPDEYLDQD